MRGWLIGFVTLLLCSTTICFADTQQEAIDFAGVEYWQAVRSGVEGVTTSRSPEHGVLISVPAQQWVKLKSRWLSPLGAIAIGGSLTMCLLIYLIVGPTKLSAPRTGRKLKRWSRLDRTLHWSSAFLFLTLSGSGLAMIYGKHLIKPWVALDVWVKWIGFAKAFHNYSGPLFLVCLLAIFGKWAHHNMINKTDIQWLMKLGGIMGKYKGTHPSAGFSNGGEKMIFWLLIVGGSLVVMTGFYLDFPLFWQSRWQMELATLVHGVMAILLICSFIFHIYMGIFQLEGSLEGMITGEVDETWAKEHHNIWYESLVQRLTSNKTGDKC